MRLKRLVDLRSRLHAERVAWYHRLRRFVDRDLNRSGGVRAGSLSLLIGMALAGGPLSFFERPYSTTATAVLILAASSALLWLSFVAWRGYRGFRAGAIRADRDYDRRGKHRLPPEYADTESSTEARRRR